jgi:hypothetical protein
MCMAAVENERGLWRLLLSGHSDWPGDKAIVRYPSRVPAFHGRAADLTFKAGDLPDQGRSFSAVVNRAAQAGSMKSLRRRLGVTCACKARRLGRLLIPTTKKRSWPTIWLPAKSNSGAAGGTAESGPPRHNVAPRHVTPPVDRLDFVRDGVRESHFGHLIGYRPSAPSTRGHISIALAGRVAPISTPIHKP